MSPVAPVYRGVLGHLADVLSPPSLHERKWTNDHLELQQWDQFSLEKWQDATNSRCFSSYLEKGRIGVSVIYEVTVPDTAPPILQRRRELQVFETFHAFFPSRKLSKDTDALLCSETSSVLNFVPSACHDLYWTSVPGKKTFVRRMQRTSYQLNANSHLGVKKMSLRTQCFWNAVCCRGETRERGTKIKIYSCSAGLHTIWRIAGMLSNSKSRSTKRTHLRNEQIGELLSSSLRPSSNMAWRLFQYAFYICFSKWSLV